MSERRETAHLLGPEQLVGIVCHGVAPESPSSSLPTAVFLDPGMIHRIGPQRLWVRLARRLADRGWTSLRFDYSGVGDTPPRRDRVPFYESRLAETEDALDWLQETDAGKSFVLVGLCTGADYAFQTALRDDRIAGLVLLDPYPFRTPGWSRRYHARRLLRPRVWWRFLRGRYGGGRAVLRQLWPVEAPSADQEVARVIPSRDEAAENLRDLVAREVPMLWIHTGGMPAWYNYAGQFQETFADVAWQKVVQVEFFEEADHVFTPMGSQAALLDRIERWLVDLEPPTAVPRPA